MNAISEIPAVTRQNPLSKYPIPPYPVSEQDTPGIEANIQTADYGETSYKGSGKLNGRKALITGGESGIGRHYPFRHAHN